MTKEWYGYGYKHLYLNPRVKVHATQKPVEVLEHCLAIVGGVVLDCFCGSGSTGVACANLGLDFIGVEKSKPYYEIAQKQFKEAKEQGRFKL